MYLGLCPSISVIMGLCPMTSIVSGLCPDITYDMLGHSPNTTINDMVTTIFILVMTCC